MLIGTFADEVNDDSDLIQLDDNEKQLKQQLEETQFYKNGLVEFSDLPEAGNILFRVNNKNGGESEIIKYRQLFERLMANRFKKYAIPVKWFEFSIYLKLLANRKKTFAITFSDCLIIGSQLKMSKERVQVALQFLHKYIGLILYFPENEKLKDIVICDPQAVFSSVSELIFDVYNPTKRFLPHAKCRDFIETGHFSISDIKSPESGTLLSKEILIELLVHLNIAAPSKSMYFLPAVLRSAADELLQPIESERVLEPLCVSFQIGYLPLGFICALIAKLANEGKFQLLGREQRYEIYKNKVTFRFRGRYDITLISWPKYCEFRVALASGARIDEDFSNENCCPLIRDTICEAINQIINSMRQSSVFHLSRTYTLGFKCPNHASNADYGHAPQAVFDLNNIQDMECDICKLSPPLRPAMAAWLAPRITNQPPSQISLEVGKTVTLSIAATGAKPLNYQWFKDASKLFNADKCFQGISSPTLQIHAISTGLGGSYYCEVSNGFGGVHSTKVSVLTGKKITGWLVMSLCLL